MTHIFRTFFYNKCGSIAVEFALVAPLLFLIMFGLIEMGRLYYIRSNLQYAADEAGRYVMLNITASDSSISTKVSDNITAVPTSDVTITISAQTIGSQSYKNIAVSYSFTTVVEGIVNLGTIPVSIQSSVPLVN